MAEPTTELQPIRHFSETSPNEMPAALQSSVIPSPSSKPTTSCKRCSSPTSWLSSDGYCMECMERAHAERAAEDEARDILEHLEERVNADLDKVGLSPREIRAEWSRVPRALRDAMPRDVLRPLSEGVFPARGFGLGSETGRGKSMAVAAILRGFLRARLQVHADKLPEWVKANPSMKLTRKLGVVWLCWPDTVTLLRAHAVEDLAEDLLARAESSPLLVLDDLGRERIKGSYVDDWAASQLDRIINHRYRNELPTLWTTNVHEDALVGIYGAALISRLIEDAPLAWVDGLPSMRLR